MAIDYNSEEMYEEYKLTDEQIKACKAVFKAINKAGLIGVEFWDYYGTLTAYNGNVFRAVSMEDADHHVKISSGEGSELTYYESLSNFAAGCADDDVYLELH